MTGIKAVLLIGALISFGAAAGTKSQGCAGLGILLFILWAALTAIF